MASAANISSQLATAKNSGLLSVFNQVSRKTGVDRNLLLAIASRESNMGLSLDSNYLGDGGNGMGIMQIDRRWHPSFAASVHPADHEKIIRKAADILKQDLKAFGGNIRYAVAAYNAGKGNVTRAIAAGLDPDTYTTGKNYSRDVLNRYRIINQVVPQTALASLNIWQLLMIAGVAGAAFYSFTKS